MDSLSSEALFFSAVGGVALLLGMTAFAVFRGSAVAAAHKNATNKAKEKGTEKNKESGQGRDKDSDAHTLRVFSTQDKHGLRHSKGAGDTAGGVTFVVEAQDSYETKLRPFYASQPITALLLADLLGATEVGHFVRTRPSFFKTSGRNLWLAPNPPHMPDSFWERARQPREQVSDDALRELCLREGFRLFAFWFHPELECFTWWQRARDEAAGRPLAQPPADYLATPFARGVHDTAGLQPWTVVPSGVDKPSVGYLHCVRDLSAEHAPVLRRLITDIHDHLQEAYHLTCEDIEDSVLLYFHYPNKPIFSTLHLHVAFRKPESPLAQTRSHSIEAVIRALETVGYYDPTNPCHIDGRPGENDDDDDDDDQNAEDADDGLEYAGTSGARTRHARRAEDEDDNDFQDDDEDVVAKPGVVAGGERTRRKRAPPLYLRNLTPEAIERVMGVIDRTGLQGAVLLRQLMRVFPGGYVLDADEVLSLGPHVKTVLARAIG